MDTNDLVRRLNLSVTIRCSEQPPKPMLDTSLGVDLTNAVEPAIEALLRIAGGSATP
jgi:hypothetical protein